MNVFGSNPFKYGETILFSTSHVSASFQTAGIIDVEWASNLLTCVFTETTVTHVRLDWEAKQKIEGLGNEPQYRAKMETEDKNASSL